MKTAPVWVIAAAVADWREWRLVCFCCFVMAGVAFLFGMFGPED